MKADNPFDKSCVQLFHKTAFSLIEILVVLFIISLLMGILIPSLSRARLQGLSAVCRSNIRQLYLANEGYSEENDGFYVRAAPDIFEGSGGRHRWHGVREADGVDPDPELNTFDPLKSPLKDYLADGKVKQCPRIVKFVEDGAKNAFEAGCGGYGYNSIGVGSRAYKYGYCDKAARSSMKTTEIKQTYTKVMFTDTAFLQGDTNKYIIEYSFCEPPHFVFFNGIKIIEAGKPVPSIHFRHLGKTNVIWCDGHVSSEPFAFSKLEQEVLKRFKIGWFGPEDNRLFRP
jgi:prepilin-type processing-associated H-X9-DG protein/prepilin-type N-terminal cleavage/methylation domain-containing protein